jgi:hypothetical protein
LGPWTCWVRSNGIADELARSGCVLGFLEPEPAWESLDRRYDEGLVVGWSSFTGYDGEVVAIPKDRLENYFRNLVWVPRLGFCPLTGFNSGLLLASSLDITH